MGVSAPLFFILGPRVICSGSLVTYVSVLEPHFKPCGRLRRWRIDEVHTAQ